MLSSKRRIMSLLLLSALFVLCSWQKTFGGVSDSIEDKTVLDKGGVSIDLATLKTGDNETAGDNLITNGAFTQVGADGKPTGWTESFWVYHSNEPERKACMDALQDFAVRKFCKGDSPDAKSFYEFSYSEDDYAKHKTGDFAFSSAIKTCVVVAEPEKETKFVLKVHYRGSTSPVPKDNSFGALIQFWDKADNYKSGGKQIGEYKYLAFPMRSEWTTGEMAFTVPKSAKSLTIDLRKYGCGNIQIDEASLFKATEKGLSIRMVPFSFLDNTFYLSSGQPEILRFACKNEFQQKLNKPVVVLELPEEFDVAGVKLSLIMLSKSEIKRGDNKYYLYKVAIDGIKYAIAKCDYYAANDAVDFLVRTSLPASDKAYEARYWYEDGDYKTEPLSFSLKVMPTIRGKTPKIFESGVCFNVGTNFGDDNVADILCSFYVECGFNAAHLYDFVQWGVPEKFSASLLKKGIKRYTEPGWLSNGYRIGKEKKPDDAAFKLADGSNFNDGVYDCICPVEVYTRGKYFQEFVEKALRKILVEKNSADSIMANWEPYMFENKGCFCAKCKSEFIKFSGLSADEVDAQWPKRIPIKHRAVWTKFRSWQNGKVVAALEETISRIGAEAGKKSHFIPEISTASTFDEYFAQYSPADFIDKLPVIEFWGPYVCQLYNQPYSYVIGSHLLTFLMAKDAAGYAHEKALKNPPKLIAFPQGFQGNSMITEPEAIAFEYLCFFLQRWDGALAYYFPYGYDARYWAALARANTLIAETEDFIFHGVRTENFTVKFETPVPEYYLPTSWDEGKLYARSFPSAKEKHLLVQVLEYMLDGKRLIAVGNFWEKGEVFFTLRLNDLDKNTKYALYEPDHQRCYANDKGEAEFFAEDLSSGILLHAGALRWSFFVIEPLTGADYGVLMTPQQMRTAMTKRLPGIMKAAEIEKKRFDDYKAATVRPELKKEVFTDLSAFKPAQCGELRCQIEKSADGKKTFIVFSKGGNKLTIDPSCGAKVSSWIVDKTELVNKNDDNAGLCGDCFWWPANLTSQMLMPYEFDKVLKNDSSITVQFKKKLDNVGTSNLDAVTITKTYSVFADGSGFQVNTQFDNMSTACNREFSFRYHNMLSFLGTQNDKDGRALMRKGNADESFKRDYDVRLYRIEGADDSALENLFKMDKIIDITTPEIVFDSPWSKVKLAIDAVNKNDLHSFVFWDSAKQSGSTFEPIFKKISLPPGKSWAASMTFKIGGIEKK